MSFSIFPQVILTQSAVSRFPRHDKDAMLTGTEIAGKPRRFAANTNRIRLPGRESMRTKNNIRL